MVGFRLAAQRIPPLAPIARAEGVLGEHLADEFFGLLELNILLLLRNLLPEDVVPVFLHRVFEVLDVDPELLPRAQNGLLVVRAGVPDKLPGVPDRLLHRIADLAAASVPGLGAEDANLVHVGLGFVHQGVGLQKTLTPHFLRHLELLHLEVH